MAENKLQAGSRVFRTPEARLRAAGNRNAGVRSSMRLLGAAGLEEKVLLCEFGVRNFRAADACRLFRSGRRAAEQHEENVMIM